MSVIPVFRLREIFYVSVGNESFWEIGDLNHFGTVKDQMTILTAKKVRIDHYLYPSLPPMFRYLFVMWCNFDFFVSTQFAYPSADDTGCGARYLKSEDVIEGRKFIHSCSSIACISFALNREYC